MTLTAFEVIVKSEDKARSYLRRFCWHDRHIFCAHCRGHKTYRIRGTKYRCRRCGYTFHDFSNRWINEVKVPCKTWLWILKLFELEVPAKEIARQVGISYPTALKAVHVIRTSIVAAAPEAEGPAQREAGPAGMRSSGRLEGTPGQRALERVPVFGILAGEGTVKVSVVKDMTAGSLLGMTVGKARRGPIVFTDKFQGYDALMVCGDRRLRRDDGTAFSRGQVRANGLEGFWAYAERRLARSRIVSKDKLPLYLKEIAFRYNNRSQDVFGLLAENLCGLVPRDTVSGPRRSA